MKGPRGGGGWTLRKPLVAMAAIHVACLSWSGSVDAQSAEPARRIAGDDRYGTSAAVSREIFAGPNPPLFVASGETFADSLSAGAAAGQLGVPLLLTSRSQLPNSIREELSRLQPRSITIVGGPAAVSESVAAELRSHSTDVTRIFGEDRFDTAAAVSRSAYAPNPPTVYVVSGENYPDALAAASTAGLRGDPLLLVRHAALPNATVDELDRLQPARVVLAGGPLAIDPSVEAGLREFLPNARIDRIGGADRYETAVRLAQDAFGEIDGIAWASGADFPDALSAAPFSAARNSPLLLVRPDCVPEVVRESIEGLDVPIVAIGGERAISADVVDRRVSCGTGEQPPPPPAPGLDVDGDGLEDRATAFEDHMLVEFGSGQNLAYTHDGYQDFDPEQPRSGDLNEDLRDDLIVRTSRISTYAFYDIVVFDPSTGGLLAAGTFNSGGSNVDSRFGFRCGLDEAGGYVDQFEFFDPSGTGEGPWDRTVKRYRWSGLTLGEDERSMTSVSGPDPAEVGVHCPA